MKRLNENLVKEMILKEVEDYLDSSIGGFENIHDEDELLNALDGFSSLTFMQYENQEHKELMWNIFINKDNLPEIEILEV